MKEKIDPTAAQKISSIIKELGDWRGQKLQQVRELIKEADPDVVEEWKWASATKPGVPVWSHNGVICTGESYKDHLKLTFLKGGSIMDPAGLFTSGMQGGGRRAIDIHEADIINEAAFKELIAQAVALNLLKHSE